MKKCISLLLVFSLLLSMTGCSVYIDGEEIMENIKAAVQQKLQEMFQDFLDGLKALPGKIFGGIGNWFKGLFGKKDKEPAATTETLPDIQETTQESIQELPQETSQDSQYIPETTEAVPAETKPVPPTTEPPQKPAEEFQAKLQMEEKPNSAYDYYIAVASDGIDVRIVRDDALGNVYLVDRNMKLETFKQYPVVYEKDQKKVFSDEEYEILLILYKAQDIGPEMLQLLQSIQSGGDPFTGGTNSKKKEINATDYIKAVKWWVDTSFAFAEKDKYIKGSMKKEDFLEKCLGAGAKNVIKAGEEAEKIFGLAKVAAAAYELSKEYDPNSTTVDFKKKNTMVTLDAAEQIVGIIPTPPVIGDLVKTQIKGVKDSCEKYFDGCANRVMFYTLTSDLAGSKNLAVADVFKIDYTGRDPEWTFLMKAFNGGDVRANWGASHMPTLAEILNRLSQPFGTGTRYDQIGIEDALYGTSYQHMIAKYIEFRIHFEFENMTNISLEYYYNLITTKKNVWGQEKAPWEKDLKASKYPFFNPVMTSEDVKIQF